MQVSGNSNASKPEETVIANRSTENCCRIIHVSAKRCLLDHPEIWNRLKKKPQFQKNQRLFSLMNQHKNSIVQLPNKGAVTSMFSCTTCLEIPFPWKGDTRLLKFENSNVTYKEGLLLCKTGHVVCRNCFKYSYRCASLLDPAAVECSSLEVGVASGGSMENWGEVRLCLSPITSNTCHFLTETINSSEFACHNFYNWCDFRGRGNDLMKHEEKCLAPFQAVGSQNHLSLSNPFVEKNDETILTLQQEILISRLTLDRPPSEQT